MRTVKCIYSGGSKDRMMEITFPQLIRTFEFTIHGNTGYDTYMVIYKSNAKGIANYCWIKRKWNNPWYRRWNHITKSSLIACKKKISDQYK